MQSKDKNLVIILGPTGAGKSATALKIARIFDGEIINCDSMQVYKGFDIGTDKLHPEKRENIPHHLLDVRSHTQQFTAADFANLALKAVRAIHKKGRLPIIAGGTGLYLKAFLNGLFPEGKKDPLLRRRLEKEAKEKGLEFLSEKLKEADPAAHEKIGSNDRIRIIRALEVFYATSKPISEHFRNTKSSVADLNIMKIGLKLERKELYKRIEDRVDRMFERGLVQEVKNLLNNGANETLPPFRALGYKHVLKYLKGELSLEEAVILTKKDTRHYAKRQMTWFRKMEGIRWFSPLELSSIQSYIQNHLK